MQAHVPFEAHVPLEAQSTRRLKNRSACASIGKNTVFIEILN